MKAGETVHLQISVNTDENMDRFAQEPVQYRVVLDEESGTDMG